VLSTTAPSRHTESPDDEAFRIDPQSRCRLQMLAVKATGNDFAAGGHEAVFVQLQNIGERACYLSTYLDIVLLGPSGELLRTYPYRDDTSSRPVEHLRLEVRGYAYAQLGFFSTGASVGCAGSPVAFGLLVHLDQVAGSSRIRLPSGYQFSPCFGELPVHPLTAGMGFGAFH
jgi:tetrahydromethanopterin S-methyltransferase subunit B